MNLHPHLRANRPVFVISVLLALPAAAWGQNIDHEDGETLRPATRVTLTEKQPDLNEAAKLIIDQTNAFRKQEGQAPLSINPKLTDAARYFAGYMARTGKYGHTADDQRPADRATKHGYESCILAENIAYQYHSLGFTTADLAQQFFEGWKNSPGHRKNMLDADVTETAVVLAQDAGSGYYYAVQLFGRPKSQSIQFQIANQTDATVEYQVGSQTFPLPPGYIRTHQRCRPAELKLPSPEGKDGAAGLRPASGDRYAIVGEGKQVKLKKE
jgi:uncharacterized protein YkwD